MRCCITCGTHATAPMRLRLEMSTTVICRKYLPFFRRAPRRSNWLNTWPVSNRAEWGPRLKQRRCCPSGSFWSSGANISQAPLTIHSSRTRFAGRLNSGVRPLRFCCLSRIAAARGSSLIERRWPRSRVPHRGFRLHRFPSLAWRLHVLSAAACGCTSPCQTVSRGILAARLVPAAFGCSVLRGRRSASVAA
jgi:hypothetical protein